MRNDQAAGTPSIGFVRAVWMPDAMIAAGHRRADNLARWMEFDGKPLVEK
jgi:hypothetical protein